MVGMEWMDGWREWIATKALGEVKKRRRGFLYHFFLKGHSEGTVMYLSYQLT